MTLPMRYKKYARESYRHTQCARHCACKHSISRSGWVKMVRRYNSRSGKGRDPDCSRNSFMDDEEDDGDQGTNDEEDPRATERSPGTQTMRSGFTKIGPGGASSRITPTRPPRAGAEQSESNEVCARDCFLTFAHPWESHGRVAKSPTDKRWQHCAQ